MARRSRSLRLIAVAAALAALGAFTAGSALAAHTGHQWSANGTKLTNGQSETVGCEKASEKFTFTGEILGSKLKMTAGKMECVESKITQDIVGENGIATDSGKLKFSELTVDEPAGCSVEQPITTVALQTQLVTNAGVTSGMVDTFKPASGTTIANVTLTGCAAAETYPWKGSFCSEVSKPGTEAVKQRTVFVALLHTVCDVPTLGGKTFLIVGEDWYFLNGIHLGQVWGWWAF